MRKLAIFALILLIVATIVITLGATNYGGFGDMVGNAMQTSFVMPIRNWVVNTWILIGSSGWYILAAVLTISIVGGLVMVVIVYGLFWQKLIQQKLLKKTAESAGVVPMQRTLSTPISAAEVPPVEPKKEEA